MFFVLLDVTIVNVALPAIKADLHAGPSGLEWVVDADTLGFACLMLSAGTLGDLLGRRRIALIGLAAFGAGSAACGLAPNLGILLAGRAVQGAGGALLIPQTLAIITAAYPGRAELARALGMWAGVSSLALPAGLHRAALVTATAWAVAAVVAAVGMPRRSAQQREPS